MPGCFASSGRFGRRSWRRGRSQARRVERLQGLRTLVTPAGGERGGRSSAEVGLRVGLGGRADRGGFRPGKELRLRPCSKTSRSPRAACMRESSSSLVDATALAGDAATGRAAKSSAWVIPLPEWDRGGASPLTPTVRLAKFATGPASTDRVIPLPRRRTGTVRCPAEDRRSSEGPAIRFVQP